MSRELIELQREIDMLAADLKLFNECNEGDVLTLSQRCIIVLKKNKGME